ncbi:hypothetical protein [Xiamenia xianingshaonis]|uniref:Uncharacterized protein n=1 Tax=Xiamenia xianingshaonis TaxID=2682776 RepID=A0ABX0IHT4_9ACTN|nr:hypothetical protein [Xiamenia xianingshaonis]NHM13514.1 hypothetical protein [Xiamenia xianingshaonis]
MRSRPDQKANAPHAGRHRDALLEQMWAEHSDTPYDELKDGALVLAEDWAGFKAGTEREEVWRWFDENHSKGVHWLLHEL